MKIGMKNVKILTKLMKKKHVSCKVAERRRKDRFSCGYALCYESTSNLDVIQRNRRLLAKEEDDVTTEIYKKDHDLGMRGDDNDIA